MILEKQSGSDYKCEWDKDAYYPHISLTCTLVILEDMTAGIKTWSRFTNRWKYADDPIILAESHGQDGLLPPLALGGGEIFPFYIV